MMRKGDWLCPKCDFIIFVSKPKCYKCGTIKPEKEIPKIKPENYWKPGDNDPKWDKYGPYSMLKGGYHGNPIENEPLNLKYPDCGCNHLMHCPVRHHMIDCRCYTCRGKSHKW